MEKMPAREGLLAQAIFLKGWKSFQPGQILLGKVWAAAVLDADSAPAQNDAHVISTPAHGNCYQHYHSCCY